MALIISFLRLTLLFKMFLINNYFFFYVGEKYFRQILNFRDIYKNK